MSMTRRTAVVRAKGQCWSKERRMGLCSNTRRNDRWYAKRKQRTSDDDGLEYRKEGSKTDRPCRLEVQQACVAGDVMFWVQCVADF